MILVPAIQHSNDDWYNLNIFGIVQYRNIPITTKWIYFTRQVKDFREYADLYLSGKCDEQGNPLKVIHEKVSERWEVCLAMSEKGFQQVSFVNSIATTKVWMTLTKLQKSSICMIKKTK